MKEEKAAPSEKPQVGIPLADKLSRAAKDEKVARHFRIALTVGGGIASQSYGFDFEATGDGRARCRLQCELTGRKGRSATKRIDVKRFARLLEQIRSSGVLRLPPEGPPFLPDTLVGRLLISDGESQYEYYFAADSDQAAIQDRRTPAALARAVDAIYAEGAKLMGIRSVKP